MRSFVFRFRWVVVVACLLVPPCPGALAAPLAVEGEKDRVILGAMLGHADRILAGMTAEHFADIKVPDDLCWVDLPQLDVVLTAFQFTNDPRYLRGFVGAMENLLASARTGPDGCQGWYGEPPAIFKDPERPQVTISEIATDFRAAAVISRFAEIVSADPGFEREFGTTRDRYVSFAEHHLVRKWDASFVDLGDRGAVYRSNPGYKPAFASMSLPQEKVAIMIDGLLGLYRVTGRFGYAEKAARLGLWFKRCLEFDGVRYSWNRWNPAGPWDISPSDPTRWTSWIAKEPKGIWHASSVASAVLLYRHGLVFDRRDIERFVKTQTDVCWNGDMEHPLYFTVDGLPARDGEVILASSLCAFDARLARLHFEGRAQDRRVEKSGSPWQGSVVASDWLVDKYILSRSPLPFHARKGADFLSQADPRLVRQLSFAPSPPGYQTPPRPTPEALASLAHRQ